MAIPAISGSVHGGNQPVSGSTLQLYAAGTGGYGTASTPLIPPGSFYLGGAPGCVASGSQTCYANVTSDANGSFTLTGDYTCPSASSQVYITATGGNPGLAAGTNNPAISLMAALGPCGAQTPSTFITINEVTTIGAVWPLAPFMSGSSSVGTSSTNLSGLTRAFTSASTIVNVATGTATPELLPVDLLTTYPHDQIDSLADALVPCVNTSGLFSAGTPCAQLFAAATPAGAPTFQYLERGSKYRSPSRLQRRRDLCSYPTEPSVPAELGRRTE